MARKEAERKKRSNAEAASAAAAEKKAEQLRTQFLIEYCAKHRGSISQEYLRGHSKNALLHLAVLRALFDGEIRTPEQYLAYLKSEQLKIDRDALLKLVGKKSLDNLISKTEQALRELFPAGN